MLTKTERTALKEEGLQAFKNGLTLRECPYAIYTKEEDRWCMGWWTAYYKFVDAVTYSY